MAIQAILFGLDETLLIEQGSVAAAFDVACRMARQQYDIQPQRLQDAVRRHARQLYHDCPLYGWLSEMGIGAWDCLCAPIKATGPDELQMLSRWVPYFRIQSWKKGLETFDVDDPVLAMNMNHALEAERQRCHVPFPEVRRVLHQLSQNYRLGVLTNGIPGFQQEKLQISGLGDYFECVLSSAEYGMGKPNYKFFHLALDTLQLQPHEAVMVGDGLKRDIEGAKKSTLRAVWLNRFESQRRSLNDPTPPPDAEIRSLSQLPPILARLGAA